MRQVADLSGGRLELTPFNRGELEQLGDPLVTERVGEFLTAEQHDVWVLGSLGVALGQQLADPEVRFTVDSAVLTRTHHLHTARIEIGPEPWDEGAAAAAYLHDLEPLTSYDRPFKPGKEPLRRLSETGTLLYGAVATLRPNVAPGRPDDSSPGVPVLFVPRAWDGLPRPRINGRQFSATDYPGVLAARYVAGSLLTMGKRSQAKPAKPTELHEN